MRLTAYIFFDNGSPGCPVWEDSHIQPLLQCFITAGKAAGEPGKALLIHYDMPQFGNHMVSVIEIKKQNLYLVVDPTYLLIGILKEADTQNTFHSCPPWK